MRRHRRTLFALTLGLGLWACGSTTTTSDGGDNDAGITDAGPDGGRDGGALTDGGFRSDGGVTFDGGFGTDGGFGSDAGL
jgi:hypothetical protein